jgi:uncharacterized protein
VVELGSVNEFEAIIVLAKLPDPGAAIKTRLCPPLTREEAASLYACFLADTLAAARRLAQVKRILAYTPREAEAYFRNLAPDFDLLPQTGNSLGERMQTALEAVFAGGASRVVLIGSDLPQLSPLTLEAAFVALRGGAPLVLGPSSDGGYYLVGLQQPQPQLFDITMSTPQVLAQTLERAGQLRLEYTLLPEDFDIDTGADLERLRQLLQADPALPGASTRAYLEHWSSPA